MAEAIRVEKLVKSFGDLPVRTGVDSSVFQLLSSLKGNQAFAPTIVFGSVPSTPSAPSTLWLPSAPSTASIVSGVVNYEVTIDIKKNARLLKPDMTANVSIETAQHEVLLLPSKAVQHDGEQTFVYISTPGGPQRRQVVIGAQNGESVEIKKGVSRGDDVLLIPSETRSLAKSAG